jgi:hypothetical protein
MIFANISLMLQTEDQLRMAASTNYRQEVEELDLVEKAIPPERKFGSEVQLYCSTTHALRS